VVPDVQGPSLGFPHQIPLTRPLEAPEFAVMPIWEAWPLAWDIASASCCCGAAPLSWTLPRGRRDFTQIRVTGGNRAARKSVQQKCHQQSQAFWIVKNLQSSTYVVITSWRDTSLEPASANRWHAWDPWEVSDSGFYYRQLRTEATLMEAL
jgi:hypothetical protein